MREITVVVSIDDKLCDIATAMGVSIAETLKDFLEEEGIEFLEEYLEDVAELDTD